MLPNKHVLYGSIFSLLAWALFPQIGFIGALVIFLASVFIDVDHYFASVLAGNGWSLKKAYDSYAKGEKQTKYQYVCSWIIIFHSIEFFIIALSIWYLSSGWFANFILYNIIGCLFHMVLDIIMLIQMKKPVYLKLSFFYTSYIHYRYLKYNIKPKHLYSSKCSYK
jgi:hypothetical protein